MASTDARCWRMVSLAGRLLVWISGRGQLSDDRLRAVRAASPLVIQPSAALDALRVGARREEAAALVCRLGRAWSDAQLEFILSPSSSIVVTAGAGSGKTATMVARVAVLHKVLRVPLEEIQVVSFTRDSAQEFRERLARTLLQMEGVANPAVHEVLKRAGTLRRTVSTFHSAARRLASDAGLFSGSDSLFEFHGMGRTATWDEPADQGDAPVLDVKLTGAQIVLLREVYSRAYWEDPAFRSAVTDLIDEEERRRLYKATGGSDLAKTFDEAWKWKAFIEREDEYQGCDLLPDGRRVSVRQGERRDPWWSAVHDWLRSQPDLEVGLQPAFAVQPPATTQRAALADSMEASFKVGDAYVHVDRQALPEHRQYLAPGIERLWWHQRDRKTVIAYCADGPARHISLGHGDFEVVAGTWQLAPSGRRRLATQLRLQHLIEADVSGVAPDVLLKGGREQRAWRVLYEEGAFVESHGLGVERLPGGPESTVERAVLSMLGPFWKALNAVLEERGLTRFGSILAGLSDPAVLDRIASKLPIHLLVDEFQDTSLELIVWLREWLAAAARAGRQPSIAAIGDPWQSIYAWRGSHPIFIERFPDIFPAKGRQVHRVTMSENYRSRQRIIDVAESVVDDDGAAGGRRRGTSKLPAETGSWPEAVRLGQPLGIDRRLARTADEHRPVREAVTAYVRELLGGLPPQVLPDGTSDIRVFELRRSVTGLADEELKRDLEAAMAALLRAHPDPECRSRRPRAELYTFHRSKGLEAEIVVIVGDSLAPDEHTLRDHVARLAAAAWRRSIPAMADLPAYSDTSRREARRLMYVALTRARLGVLWVPTPGWNGHLPAGGCYQLAAAQLQRQQIGVRRASTDPGSGGVHDI